MALPPPAVRQNPIRVIVADDYPPIADLLAEMLRKHGYDVRVVHHGGECLRVAANFRPHALIADALMNDMNGFELASIFSSRFPKCRVLVVSVDPFELAAPGPFRVSVKPIPSEVLYDFLGKCETDG